MRVEVVVQESICTHRTYEITVPDGMDLENAVAVKELLDRFYEDTAPVKVDTIVNDASIIETVAI